MFGVEGWMLGMSSFRFSILPPDKVVAKRLHLDGEHFDLFAEITPGDERRDGDEQTDERGAENQRDALRQLGGVAQAGLAEIAKHGDHSRNRADEPKQWGDADDDLQYDEAAFQPDDFMARGGLQGVHVLRLRPVEMVHRE